MRGVEAGGTFGLPGSTLLLTTEWLGERLEIAPARATGRCFVGTDGLQVVRYIYLPRFRRFRRVWIMRCAVLDADLGRLPLNSADILMAFPAAAALSSSMPPT